MSDYLTKNSSEDQIDRRGFLQCMAWAGTGMLYSVTGGILGSRVLSGTAQAAEVQAASFNFVQISDSHIGFHKPANPDVAATFRETIARINALPQAPDFILHTGDLTQLSATKEFDDLQQMLKDCRTKQVFFVPGEHDILSDNGAQYLERFGKGTTGTGWFSFDQKGVHFIGLVNVATVKEGGLGVLGEEQLAWLQKDLAPLSKSTPIIVFAHIPLWTIYPQWGWGTDDSARAMAMLQPFGSVTVLNGHIHQAMQKIEGNMTFHTARSTAFPQPAPGSAPKAGPMAVPADKLRSYLGLTSVSYVETGHSLAVIDSTLAGGK
ncbi:MAG TPA: metallophosphoesterase [Chthoniobacter sp.]|jgi:3',5'-cyclic AMP phosphodiesterase CpdA